MSKPLIIMVGADKGGVGKTQVTRALCDYLDVRFAQAPAPRVFDTQFPKGDLVQFRTTAEVINITNIDDQMKVFDAVDGITVVDIEAGKLGYTLNEFDRAGLLQEVRDDNMTIVLLHVLGPSLASLSEIGDATRLLGTSAVHFLVKNYINETEYFEWKQDSDQVRSLRRLEHFTIKVPHLKPRFNEAVQDARCSFVDFSQKDKSRTSRNNVRAWLEETWASFDKVGLGKLIAATAA
jgi:hypothetical protein